MIHTGDISRTTEYTKVCLLENSSNKSILSPEMILPLWPAFQQLHASGRFSLYVFWLQTRSNLCLVRNSQWTFLLHGMSDLWFLSLSQFRRYLSCGNEVNEFHQSIFIHSLTLSCKEIYYRKLMPFIVNNLFYPNLWSFKWNVITRKRSKYLVPLTIFVAILRFKWCHLVFVVSIIFYAMSLTVFVVSFRAFVVSFPILKTSWDVIS